MKKVHQEIEVCLDPLVGRSSPRARLARKQGETTLCDAAWTAIQTTARTTAAQAADRTAQTAARATARTAAQTAA